MKSCCSTTLLTATRCVVARRQAPPLPSDRPEGCEDRLRPLDPTLASNRRQTGNLPPDALPRAPAAVLSRRPLGRLHLQRIGDEPVPGLRAAIPRGSRQVPDLDRRGRHGTALAARRQGGLLF